MNFPIITNISQFDDILKNKKEIKLKTEIVDGIEFGIISYMIETDTTFNSALARECRGITFDMSTGDIICRPYHKFFNINQRPETQEYLINWNKINYIDTKWDGSLVMPVLVNDKIIFKSKKSFYSEVAIKATELFSKTCDKVKEKVMSQLKDGLTPLFEFLDNENPIVIQYKEQQLQPLAIRNNRTGEYQFYNTFNVNDKLSTLKEFIEYTKSLEGVEGFVIGDGSNLYKVKTQWYLNRHRALSKFSINDILELYINESIDDYISELYTYGYADKAKMLEGFRDEFSNWILEKENMASIKLEELKKKYKRTELRTQIAQEKESSIMFILLDGKEILPVIKKQLKVHFKEKYKGKIFFMGEEVL